MNARLAVAFLAVISSTGCIVVGSGGGSGGGGGGISGDAKFSWTFSGKTCAATPQVAQVKITVPGEVVRNNGVFNCTDEVDFPGTTLFDFAPGTYSYTVDGLNNGGSVIFSTSGSFTINGTVSVNVDLLPVGGQSSSAYLTWTFPPVNGNSSPSCSQAVPGIGIVSVLASIDGAAPTTIDCASGNTTGQGVQTPSISTGSHSLVLTGVDSVGYVYFRYSGSFTTFAGNPVAVTNQLPWAVGGVAVAWRLNDSLGLLTCAMGGVNDIYINFKDASGHLVYPATASEPGDKKPCTSLGVEYPYLKPGTYEVQLTGFGTAGTVYIEAAPPLTVTANAGTFVTAANATVIQMQRQ